MIEAIINVQENTLQTIQAVLRSLLEKQIVDALLVPMALPAGNTAPMLVTDPAAIPEEQKKKLGLLIEKYVK